MPLVGPYFGGGCDSFNRGDWCTEGVVSIIVVADVFLEHVLSVPCVPSTSKKGNKSKEGKKAQIVGAPKCIQFFEKSIE